MEKKELMEVRKQMLTQMEQKLLELWPSEEDSLFYYHQSEDRIVLSHAGYSGDMDEELCNELFGRY